MKISTFCDRSMPGVLGLILAGSILLGLGCEERLDGQFGVSDNLANFIETEEKATDLFRWQGLIDQTPYQWPGRADMYYDSVVGHTRHFLTIAGTREYDYGPLGFAFESVLLVTDSFTVRNFRIRGEDTTFLDLPRTITRSGFFLKLGRDSYYYGGWELWGFGYYGSASLPVQVNITPGADPSFPGDYAQHNILFNELRQGAYTRLSEMRTFEDTTELVINTETRNLNLPTRHVVRVSAYTDSGWVTQTMNRIDREHYLDTLVMSAENPRLYDIILFQAFKDDSTHRFIDGWAVPYRVF